MKKTFLFLSTALLCSTLMNSYAQRSIPLELSLLTPAENAVIAYDDTSSIVLKIKNLSASEDLHAGDTIFYHLPSQQQGRYTSLFLQNDIAAGNEQDFQLAVFRNTNTGAEDQIANFCVSVVGPAQTSLGGSWENPNYQQEGCSLITLKKREGGTDIEDLPVAASVQLYPNPAKGYTHIAIDMPRAEPVQVSVKDITGRAVRYMDLGKMQISPSSPLKLSLEGLNAGIYFVELHVGSRRLSGQLNIL